jgi:flavodoxin
MRRMKIGIVYYSRTGNTQHAAKLLEEKFKQKKNDVDLIQIEHEKKPGFFSAGKAATKQLDLPIKNTQLNLQHYDVILAGSPTWAGKPSPFITTFMKKAENAKGKKVAVFGTGMSPITGREQFKDIMRQNITNAGMMPLDHFLALNYKRGKLVDGEQHIDTFVDAVMNTKP